VSKTKIVGLLLLLPFYFLEFFKTNFIEEQLIKLGFSFGSYVFYYFANEKDPAIILPFGSKAFLFFGG
jgi:hypothetical protein